ncbi:hypothetical protein [Haloferula sp.]|uniref:hypothetical protein n=1 Tax=Haloferula sp. TaxID=2497595 RepID=UPI0032A0D8A2
MKRALMLLAILAAAVGLEYALRDHGPVELEKQDQAAPDKPVSASPAPVVTRPSAPMVKSVPQTPRKPIVLEDVVANADRLNDPNATVEEDLQIVGELLRIYSRHIGVGPEGGLNDEIVACFLGKNPKKITFLGADNAKLNEAGELLDRYGTPYYFHPVSAEQIEVRSAGPDQKLWSNDDVLLD